MTAQQPASPPVAGDAFCAIVDWGTSSFRLWLVARDGQVIGERRSHEGMMHCSQTGFEPVLSAHLQALAAPAKLPVLICGMAGAKQGWEEASYLATPTALGELSDHAVSVSSALGDIRILPGLAQRDVDAPDVMRGEETQLLGVSRRMQTGLVCMPGTHCKWVLLETGEVTGFTTFMTGELFAVISKHSILSHAVDDARPDGQHPAFVRAVDAALAHPGMAFGQLFSVRAAQLLGFDDKSDGAAHLSGLLIGAEISAIKQRYGTGQGVTLVASGSLTALYESALVRAGFSVATVDADECVRTGLFEAALKLWG